MAESYDLSVTGVASGERPSQSRQHEASKHTEQRDEGTPPEHWADEYSAPSRPPDPAQP